MLGQSFRYEQSENSQLKYQGNWGPAIQPETISSSTWVVEEGDAVLASESNTDYVTEVLVSGQPGESTIVNRVVTSGGQTEERIIKLRVNDNTIPRINRDYDQGC